MPACPATETNNQPGRNVIKSFMDHDLADARRGIRVPAARSAGTPRGGVIEGGKNALRARWIDRPIDPRARLSQKDSHLVTRAHAHSHAHDARR